MQKRRLDGDNAGFFSNLAAICKKLLRKVLLTFLPALAINAQVESIVLRRKAGDFSMHTGTLRRIE